MITLRFECPIMYIKTVNRLGETLFLFERELGREEKDEGQSRRDRPYSPKNKNIFYESHWLTTQYPIRHRD